MPRDVIDSQDALIGSEGDQVTGRMRSDMNEEGRTPCKYCKQNKNRANIV